MATYNCAKHLPERKNDDQARADYFDKLAGRPEVITINQTDKS
jgi:hypothetical protein